MRYLLSRDKAASTADARSHSSAHAAGTCSDGAGEEWAAEVQVLQPFWRKLAHLAGWCTPLPAAQMPVAGVVFVAHATSLSSAFALWLPSAKSASLKWRGLSPTPPPRTLLWRWAGSRGRASLGVSCRVAVAGRCRDYHGPSN